MTRFEQHTIQELAVAIRDCKVNSGKYDREARDQLRQACRVRCSEQDANSYLGKFPHPIDQALAKSAWLEVQAFVQAAKHQSGMWAD